MLSGKFWLQIRAINGGSRSFFFKSIGSFSTTTTTTSQAAEVIRIADMVDYLMNSLGFSKDAAITISSKVPRYRPSLEKAVSVFNYFDKLGVSKMQIKSMVSKYPGLLCCNVDKTLDPKVKFLRELGLSGLDLCNVIAICWSMALDPSIKLRILNLRELVGTDDYVVRILRRWPFVLRGWDTEMVDSNLELLRDYGITYDNIVKWIARQPRSFFTTKPEVLEDILHRVENVLGIPHGSAMFHHGFDLLCSFDMSKVYEKFGVLRSFGWPESLILKMVRTHPLTFTRSASVIQKTVDYFMNDLGYSMDFLASHPSFLSYSLEKRVKPRNEVLKILNENKLNKRKAGLTAQSVNKQTCSAH
ncbi:OLC1v1005711C1 [Oldenlandia corymbosa var. corymbosa]|uniref:OLC1v1005711C1 n=1 Tax=Oldenlandia corymbosa var. corymbosa TaxID=529605 RepID=A0AAV1DF87_OLDCO|nr:OLC1v1005711C1 [Oldenlandia corymbosa var. corymbosa]